MLIVDQVVGYTKVSCLLCVRYRIDDMFAIFMLHVFSVRLCYSVLVNVILRLKLMLMPLVGGQSM